MITRFILLCYVFDRIDNDVSYYLNISLCGTHCKARNQVLPQNSKNTAFQTWLPFRWTTCAVKVFHCSATPYCGFSHSSRPCRGVRSWQDLCWAGCHIGEDWSGTCNRGNGLESTVRRVCYSKLVHAIEWYTAVVCFQDHAGMEGLVIAVMFPCSVGMYNYVMWGDSLAINFSVTSIWRSQWWLVCSHNPQCQSSLLSTCLKVSL